MNHNDPYLALALLDLPPRATTSRANPPRAIPSRANPNSAVPPRLKETMPTWKEYGGYGGGSAAMHGKCAQKSTYVMFA